MGCLPGDEAVGDEAGDGGEGLREQFAAAGVALQLTPPLEFGDGVFDRDALRGLGFTRLPPTFGHRLGCRLRWSWGWRVDLVGVVVGQAPVGGIDEDLDLWPAVQQGVDAL